MAEKFNVTGEQRDDIEGQMIEIKRQLRLKNGSPINPELVKLALQDILKNPKQRGVLGEYFLEETLKNEVVEARPSILRLISDGEQIILKGLSGNRLIYTSIKTFKAFIDPDFSNWEINKPGIATAEIPAQVHEIVQDGTFMDIFTALPVIWGQKWLSQNQVIEFCETCARWLRQEGNATMFLIKKDENKPIDENNPNDNLVVVDMGVDGDGRSASVRRLENGIVWRAVHLHRVVSPQLIPSVI